jgi:hypothetical protein
MRTEEALAMIDEVVSLFLTRISALSARSTRDLGLRKVLDDEVFALR